MNVYDKHIDVYDRHVDVYDILMDVYDTYCLLKSDDWNAILKSV